MSTPIEPQGEPTKKNILAIASLVLGALSVAFAQFCTVPGNISSVGCLGGILAIAAIVTGVLGIRSAQQGQGKRSAVGGIFTAAIGLLVFLAVFIPSMMTPGGLWAHVGATPTPTITPTPTMTPTPTLPPTETPVPTSTPAPQTHYGEKFTITYTDEWKTLGIDEQCQGAESECLAIYNERIGIELHVYRETLPEKIDLEAETERILASFESKSMVEEVEIEVGGQRGLSRTFASQYSGRTAYIQLVVVIDGYDRYIFFVVAPSEERLMQYRDDAMGIILSTQFTTAGAPAPTAAPEPTSPASPAPTPVPEDITFPGDGFTLTYPGDWVEFDSSDASVCQQPDAACLFLRHTSEDGTEFLLIRQPLEEDLTAEEIDQLKWDQYTGAELISKDAVEIDGHPGIKRVFSFPYSGSPTGQLYVLQVFIVNENDLYQLISNTTTAELMMKHQAAVEGIINNLKFTE